MNEMNLDKIANTMDEFENMFESLDIVSEHIDVSIGQTVATTTPKEQVDMLISQVAEEHNLQIREEIPMDNNSQLPNQYADYENRLGNLKH